MMTKLKRVLLTLIIATALTVFVQLPEGGTPQAPSTQNLDNSSSVAIVYTPLPEVGINPS